MDAIELHDQIVTHYKDYIGSFIDIRDADIADNVAKELKSGKLWQDPMIQFNPAYEKATSIDALVKEGVLQEQLAKVFAGYRLYSHQGTALRLGATRKSFVVTSGTGSGKSLTYIGTIFNALFADSAPSSFHYIITTTEAPPGIACRRSCHPPAGCSHSRWLPFQDIVLAQATR